jgi:flagellin
MTRINTNIQSMVAARVYNNNQAKLNTAMTRLSTGLRVNSGKDDPAGLIASEGMRSDITSINSAITNAKRADSMVSTAEGALNEVSSLLNDLQGLVNTSSSTGTLSAEETAANQQQIDSILDSINRISSSTEFSGKKLLDGSLDYTTTNVAAGNLTDVRVNSARVAPGATLAVTLDLVQSATAAKQAFTGLKSVSGTTTLQISGKYGTETFAFGSGTTNANMVTAINAVKTLTGVSAASAGGKLNLMSTEFGSNGLVSVTQISNTLNKTMGFALTAGQDAKVSVNGNTVVTNGLNLSVRSSTLDLDITLAAGWADGPLAGSTTTFNVTGGGANFMIGQTVGLANTASLGFASMATSKLGRGDIGYLASLANGGVNALSSKNFSTAQRVLDSAISQVSTLRGRLGAFQKNTLGSTMNSLQVALENTSAAESAIRDADFATETANMTRQQIMVQAGTATLRMANQAPQSVLGLMQ